MSNPVKAPSEEEEIEAPPENGDDDEPEASSLTPGRISTYPTGPWPEGTVERVKEELGRLSQEQHQRPAGSE